MKFGFLMATKTGGLSMKLKNEQVKQIARLVVDDVQAYIKENREEYELFLRGYYKNSPANNKQNHKLHLNKSNMEVAA